MPPCAALVLALSTLPEAAANEIAVPADYATIELAVAQAGEGDTILIDGGHVSPVATSAILVDRTLTFRGDGGRPTLIGGDPNQGYFRVENASTTLFLEGLRIDGNDAAPAVRVAEGALFLQDVIIEDTRSTGAGGAIHLEENANSVLVIEDSVITRGFSGPDADGGLIAASTGSITVRRSTLSDGVAEGDGGLIHLDNGTLLVEDAVLSGGRAAQGGGLNLRSDGNTTIQRTRLVGNAATGPWGGGAVHNQGPSVLVEDSWFEANTADSGGGAVTHRNNQSTYTSVVFCNNTAVTGNGGAIRAEHNVVEVFNGLFLGNVAGNQGGAMWVYEADVLLSRASISSSVASQAADDPGPAAWSDGVLTILDSYIADHVNDPAVHADESDAVVVDHVAWWNNAGGDFDGGVDDRGSHVTTDPQIPPPPAGSCDPTLLRPPPTSPLIGAASELGDIGAFGGADALIDYDDDGYISFDDCDDTDPTVNRGAVEMPADGVDSDCDGMELCFADTDGDGLGERESLVASENLACDGPGEFAVADDVCLGFDDNMDRDGDGIPDGCDPCPHDANPDCTGTTTTPTTTVTTTPTTTTTDTTDTTDTTGTTGTTSPTSDTSRAPGEASPEIAVPVGCGCAGAPSPSGSILASGLLVLLGARRVRRA